MDHHHFPIELLLKFPRLSLQAIHYVSNHPELLMNFQIYQESYHVGLLEIQWKTHGKPERLNPT